ncbi:MAG TPA: MFS transporter [Chitinophagaceae bacterium]|nr:MFS transporter [Chitinophagaceae bacterium]
MKLHKAHTLRILYFFLFCCTASWLPLFAEFCKNKGLTEIQTSIVLSVTPVMMFVVQPLYGMMADKIGYKKTMLIASFFSSISYLGYLYKQDFAWLVVVTVFMSLFYNTTQPVMDSLSLQLARADKRFSYGSLRIAGAAGWVVTGIVTGQIIDAININMLFVVSAISMFLVFLFTNLLQNDTGEKSSPGESSFKYFKHVVTNRTLMFLLLCVFLVSTFATTIWNFYAIYMKENGASSSLVGYGISFQGLCELPLFYFSARIIFRLGLKTTLIITVIATAIRLILYNVTKNPVAAIPIEMLHGFSWSLFWVACVEYVNKLVAEKWMATGQSLLYAAYFGVGAIAGNFWTGYLSEKMKIADIFLLNSIAVFAVAIMLFVFMKKKISSNHLTTDSSQPA